MSIDKTKLSEVENVYPLKVPPYEQYMGDFKNPSVVTKLNTMITTLHQMGRLTNQTVNQWNTVMKWIVEGGVDEIATEITETKVAAALNEVMKMLDVSLNNGLKELAENVSDKKIDELLESGQFESMIQSSLVEINEVVENKLDGFNLQLADTGEEVDTTKLSALNNVKPLYINTFDGSNEPYHPSVKHFPNTFGGFYYWMAYTPFPVSATPYVDRWECPSIAASMDGKNWVKPAVLNPLVDLTPEEITRKDYFSDTSLVMNGNTMEVWYRKTNGSDPTKTDIYRITTLNGTTWTVPQLVLDSQNVNSGVSTTMRSMQLLYAGGTYRSYYCDGAYGAGSKIVFAESVNPSSGVWTNRKECVLNNRPVGFNPWHVGLTLVNGVYEALIYDTARKSVDYFRSTDGINFDFVKTILKPSASIVNWYQTYPTKVGSSWYVYAGITTDNKNGIMLLQGQDLTSLQPVDGDGQRNYSRGSFLVDNKETTPNPSQNLFITMDKGTTNSRYGYGMDILGKSPMWARGNDLQQIPTILYGNKSLVTPTHLGQYLKDQTTGGLFLSTQIGSVFEWRPIWLQVPTDRTAATTITTGGFEIIRLAATEPINISFISGGLDWQKIILTNTSNHPITLVSSFGDNSIVMQNKENHVLLSGTSVQLLATPVSTGIVRWHIL